MASALAGRIVNPRSDGVVYGPDVARTELPELLARVGAARAFLVTTPSLERSGLAAEVAGWMGPKCVGTFAGSREHTPAPVVIEAAEAARAAGADGLVSLGGSSVVDLTKGVALLLAEGGELADHRIRAGAPRPDLRAPKVAHIAVPTTLSGAEFTAVAGITDPVAGEKQMYADRQLLPRWVVFDSVLAASCPARLWAGTGMKVVADTIEVLSRGGPTRSRTLLRWEPWSSWSTTSARRRPRPMTTSPAAGASSPWRWCSRSSPPSVWDSWRRCATSWAAASASPTARRPRSCCPT